MNHMDDGDPDPFELALAAFVIFVVAASMYVFTLVAGFGGP